VSFRGKIWSQKKVLQKLEMKAEKWLDSTSVSRVRCFSCLAMNAAVGQRTKRLLLAGERWDICSRSGTSNKRFKTPRDKFHTE
jgi:hypothetical protein